MAYQINTNMLTPGDTVAIHGTVEFSRIVTKIDGEELAQDQQRRAALGWAPIDRPYTSITINNAQILPKNPDEPTLIEQYADERLYQPNGDSGHGFWYTATDKGPGLPWVAVQRDASNPDAGYDQIQPEGELGVGLEVIVILRCFEAPGSNGVALSGVICTDGIVYDD